MRVSDLDRVSAWLTLPDLVERYGERLSTVRRWLDDRELIGIRRGEHKALAVPAEFLDETGPLAALRAPSRFSPTGG